MGDDYYVRTKSSLTGKRVKKDPAFTLTMVYADLLAQDSKLASKVYRQLPAELKGRQVYQQLTGRALRLLKQGLPPATVSAGLQAEYMPEAVNAEAVAPVQPGNTGVVHPPVLEWVDRLLEEVLSVNYTAEVSSRVEYAPPYVYLITKFW